MGCDTANKAIRTLKRAPNKNSEPEYSRMRKNSAMVLNHSPIQEITAANQNLLNAGFLRMNEIYPEDKIIPPRQNYLIR